jgi:glutamate mutase epsilon subunit
MNDNNDKVNGYPVLEYTQFPARRLTRAGRVIIAFREGHPVHRFVVAAQFGHANGTYDSQWYQGYYHATLEEALAEYQEQVARYLPTKQVA